MLRTAILVVFHRTREFYNNLKISVCYPGINIFSRTLSHPKVGTTFCRKFYLLCLINFSAKNNDICNIHGASRGLTDP